MLLCTKLDRLARSVADLVKLEERLKAKGASICIMDPAMDTGTPNGRLMFNVIAAIAQFEREVMLARLDEIARQGAEHMLRMALSAEIEAYIASLEGVVLPDGRPAIVRNGNHRPRFITVGSGQVEAVVPRTRDRRPGGAKDNFVSSIIPPYMRRSPKIDEVIPLLYFHFVSNWVYF